MPILRAKKVTIETLTTELEVTPTEAEELTTDQAVDAFVDARGGWAGRFDQDECDELVESWEITEE